MGLIRTSWFTFGFAHVHALNGFTYDKDVVVQITALDPRAIMIQNFGKVWSFEYGEEPDMSYFPRGIKVLR